MSEWSWRVMLWECQDESHRGYTVFASLIGQYGQEWSAPLIGSRFHYHNSSNGATFDGTINEDGDTITGVVITGAGLAQTQIFQRQ